LNAASRAAQAATTVSAEIGPAVATMAAGVSPNFASSAGITHTSSTPSRSPITDSISAETVVAACAARLAAFKVPRYVVFQREPLPRMASGKIARRELRARYADLAATHERVR
jgi:acyl-CoA synthetase (AMP-forming)/AMP-acid ligase II